MKRIFQIFMLIIVLAACDDTTEGPSFFYYYGDQKFVLLEDQSSIQVKLADNYSDTTKIELAMIPGARLESSAGKYVTMAVLLQADPGKRYSTISFIRSRPGVECANFKVRYDKTLLGYTNEFIVQFTGSAADNEIKSLMTATGVTFADNAERPDRTFVLEVSKDSRYTLFQAVEEFRVSGLVKYSEPNFVGGDINP